MVKVTYDNIMLLNDSHCKDCGWPILAAACNGSMAKLLPYSSFDFWIYCSNKACCNHVGVGETQFPAPFII